MLPSGAKQVKIGGFAHHGYTPLVDYGPSSPNGPTYETTLYARPFAVEPEMTPTTDMYFGKLYLKRDSLASSIITLTQPRGSGECTP